MTEEQTSADDTVDETVDAVATPDEDNALFGITVPPRPQIRLACLFGVIVILLFFGGMFVWSYVAPLESAAVTQGQVIVAGNRRTIQHLEGGIVKKLYVKDSERIKKGDALILLESAQVQAALQLHQGDITELSGIKARLVAERDDLAHIVFPSELLADRDQSRVRDIIKSQNKLFQANQSSFSKQMHILKKGVTQLEEQIKGARAQIVSYTQQLGLIEKEIHDVAFLEKKRLIPRSRLLSLQREKARLTGVRSENESMIARLQQKIGETELKMLAATSERKKEVLSALSDVQQKLSDAREREKAIQDVLSRTTIRSPQDGVVVGLKVHTLGGIIKPGEPIMDIVPTNEELLIETRVKPTDIDVVHPGLTAKVQLTAFKQRNAPNLYGLVTRVSADVFQDAQTGESYYTARITIPKKEIDKLRGQTLHPGMPAQVMIISENRSLWDYFTSPIKDSFGRAFKEQ